MSKPRPWPRPPADNADWRPPGELPDGLVSAARALFDHGLADPRQCRYREIEVHVGSVWGESGSIETAGWVLPDNGDERRFAVAWSGLVYPVEEVGPDADLADDVAAMIARDDDERTAEAERDPERAFYRFRRAWPEYESAARESLLPVRAVLLARLGEAALAAQVWNTWHIGMRADTNDDAMHLRDPYLMLATDWAWALYDRAVCAHIRGDDEVALLSVEAVIPAWSAINRVAEQRGFTTRTTTEHQTAEFLPFLGPARRLLADQQRRAGPQPERVADPQPPSEQVADPQPPPKRVAALIAELDTIAARQMSQPGGVSVANEPVVEQLIACGNDAALPLLDVLEDDHRLTRSMSFHRDFSHHRHLIGVHEAAYFALTQIFGMRAQGETLIHTDDGRRELARRMRAYWSANAALSREQRWYRALADDDASPERWIEVAHKIIGFSHLSSPAEGWGSARRPAGRPPDPMPGESLRDDRSPSVTELLIRRLRACNASRERDGSYRRLVTDSGKLAVALGHWDPVGAALTLRGEITRAIELIAPIDPRYDSSETEYLAMCMAQHVLALIRAGDDRALHVYMRWLREATVNTLGTNQCDAFEPLWLHPHHPAVAEFLDWAYSAPTSPWTPLVQPENYGLGRLLHTPMVQVAQFRARVVTELADRTPVAEFRVIDDHVHIHGYDDWRDYAVLGRKDPLAPASGTSGTVRRCDHLASRLLAWVVPDDAPRFSVCWPVEHRDRAVDRIIAYVRALPLL